MNPSVRLRRIATSTVVALLLAACGVADEAAPEPESPADEPEPANEEPEPEESADEDEPDGARVDDALHLGYVLPESGPLAFLGPSQIKAIELAVADMNDAGGVLGNEVTLSPGDETGNPIAAAEAARRLIDEGVNAIVGAAAPGSSLAFVEAVTDAGVLQCSASNTRGGFTTADYNGLYLRTVPSDSLQGAFAADLILGDGHTNPAVLARADDEGHRLLEAVTAAIEDAGATVATEILYDPQATEFDAEVDEVIDSDADALYLIGFDESAGILAALIERDHGPREFPIYGSDGLRSGDLASLVDPDDPAALEGLHGTAPIGGTGDEQWIDRFTQQTGIDRPAYGPEAYDCGIIIGLAAELAGSSDGKAMSAHLLDVTAHGASCSTFEACKQLIASGEDIAYQTASGIVLERTQTENHEPDSAPYEVWRIDAEGAVETVRTELASF